jgi:predicted ATP-grasp superfamily ATP-dependent carboligase
MAQDWRTGANWDLVGARKAIRIANERELLATYAQVSRAHKRLLLQELVPGGDEHLLVAACYLDQQSEFVAGFNARKLVQEPAGFGTGCIVQADSCPEIFEPTVRLLRSIRFTGIAEVEYKWNTARQEYQLIEINPRPWDQHRLGKGCGTDLIHIAYCDYAGLPRPVSNRRASTQKWIAEDTFLLTALKLLLRRDPKFLQLVRSAKGQRSYAIWSLRDPLPFLGYLITQFLPSLVSSGWRALRATTSRTRQESADVVKPEHSREVVKQ